MIREDEVVRIGKFQKPHGIKGEITLAFDSDIFDRIDCPYLICDMDGILVPFFVESYRFKGTDTALILFEDIDSDFLAKKFQGIDVYFSRHYFDEEEEAGYTLDYFIGFLVVDKIWGEIGCIVDIDDATVNTLFLIHDKFDNEVIVPASDDFIENIDSQNKILYLNLPQGLVDI